MALYNFIVSKTTIIKVVDENQFKTIEIEVVSRLFVVISAAFIDFNSLWFLLTLNWHSSKLVCIGLTVVSMQMRCGIFSINVHSIRD